MSGRTRKVLAALGLGFVMALSAAATVGAATPSQAGVALSDVWCC